MSVVGLSVSKDHKFTKDQVDAINLVANIGIEGDCHSGESVQHLSRMKVKSLPKNLRQVHLIDRITLEERDLSPGEIGENITTQNIDLLNLSAGTKLVFTSPGIEPDPVIVLTGLRNPCYQIDNHRAGLKETFLVRDADRKIVARKAGVMAVVEVGGIVKKDAKIVVEHPVEFQSLIPV